MVVLTPTAMAVTDHGRPYTHSHGCHRPWSSLHPQPWLSQTMVVLTPTAMAVTDHCRPYTHSHGCHSRLDDSFLTGGYAKSIEREVMWFAGLTS
ncbi:hypothetical protein ACOMHN_003605 [Nucella lapillus]